MIDRDKPLHETTDDELLADAARERALDAATQHPMTTPDTHREPSEAVAALLNDDGAYLHRALNAAVFGVPAEAIPDLHERLDRILAALEAKPATEDVGFICPVCSSGVEYCSCKPAACPCDKDTFGQNCPCDTPTSDVGNTACECATMQSQTPLLDLHGVCEKPRTLYESSDVSIADEELTESEDTCQPHAAGESTTFAEHNAECDVSQTDGRGESSEVSITDEAMREALDAPFPNDCCPACPIRKTAGCVYLAESTLRERAALEATTFAEHDAGRDVSQTNGRAKSAAEVTDEAVQMLNVLHGLVCKANNRDKYFGIDNTAFYAEFERDIEARLSEIEWLRSLHTFDSEQIAELETLLNDPAFVRVPVERIHHERSRYNHPNDYMRGRAAICDEFLREYGGTE